MKKHAKKGMKKMYVNVSLIYEISRKTSPWVVPMNSFAIVIDV
jgi:hypothetical protein